MIFLAFLISFKTKSITNFQNIHMFDLVRPEKKSFDLTEIFENWGAKTFSANIQSFYFLIITIKL